MNSGVDLDTGSELKQLVAELRSSASGLQGAPGAHGERVLDALDQLDHALSRIVRENTGLADELLRIYEQIGVVFEVTRQLPTATTEAELVSLFVKCLAPVYPADRIIAASPNGTSPSLDVVPDYLAGDVREAVGGEQVIVMQHQRPGGEPTVEYALTAPVLAGNDCMCVIIVLRSGSGRGFDSNDMSFLEALRTFCGDLLRNLRLVEELKQVSVDTVKALVSAVDQKDPYTSGHSTRVGLYATMLGRESGFEGQVLQMLEWSALLHDVGKIGIRDDVLKKTGRLTDEEFAHIKEHPVRSHTIVKSIPQLSAALDGVLYHHEHYDGSGYPQGLRGEDIPLQARVIQIADVFDALTTTRSYRAKFTWQGALEIMRKESGTVVDAKLAARFDDIVRRCLDDDPDFIDRLRRDTASTTDASAAEPQSHSEG